MENRATILKELEGFAPVLAAISSEMPYKTPENYFDNLPDNISVEAFLAMISGTTFTISADYFNTFADRVLRKINQQKVSEELQEISPFLAKLSKENVYKIPQHYFNSLQSLEAVKVENKVKSISTRFVSKWISYAAAAVITGVLITGAYMYTNHKGNFDLTNEINKVSDDELQNYLSLSIAHPAAVANEETTSNINAPETLDVKQEMQFVSDEELQEYINENYETQKNTDQQQLNVGS
jgi:hypothetical protein